MKTILALAALLSVALAQNVIFDAAPYHHGGYLGYHHGPAHGYFGNYLASGAVPGYAVWPGYFGHGLPVKAEEEAAEDDAAVEEASRKKRSVVLAHHGLGHLGYGLHGYAGYSDLVKAGHLKAGQYFAPYAYSHAYAAPYAFGPYAHHLGAYQIPHAAPYYKVAEAKEEDEPAVEEASRKKRAVVLPHHGLALGYHGLAHHAYAAPVVYTAPLVKHSYTTLEPVETEYKYKTHSYADQDEPTPADTTLVALEEEEHTAKAIHYEPKVHTYTAPAYPFYYGHHGLIAAPVKKAEEAAPEERKKRSVVFAHHGLGHLGYFGYPAAVPVEVEHKYKTISLEDSDAPTPADTTLVDVVEKEHTAKSVHFAPAFHHGLAFHH